MSQHDNYEKAEIKLNQQLIGKSIYLLCGTRPNIAFAIGQLSKYNSDPRIDHMKVAKKVVCHIKSTIHLGLVYRGQSKDKGETKTSIALSLFGLIGYENSSYAGDPENRKSVMGYCYFINGAIVSWCSKK